jgi:hypothetical protein
MSSDTQIHIWMFCGYAGSGKTHAAKHLQSIINAEAGAVAQSAATYVSAFADAVKDDVAAIYNLPRTLFDTQEGKASLVQTPDGEFTARDLLIMYSLSMKEAYGDSIWAEEVVRRIRAVTEHQSIEHVIIHDLRFTAELELMYKEFNSSTNFVLHTIRIIRPLAAAATAAAASEHNLDKYIADINIENNGTVEELNSKINDLFHSLKVVV